MTSVDRHQPFTGFEGLNFRKSATQPGVAPFRLLDSIVRDQLVWMQAYSYVRGLYGLLSRQRSYIFMMHPCLACI